MKIVFWIKGSRGVRCLNRVIESNYDIDLLVLQQQRGMQWYKEAVKLSQEHGIPVIEPENPNDNETERILRSLEPDLFVLAGYGKIVKPNIIAIPKLMCINLHGGKLPEYRGSSPMNWALINGETKFGISIIKVDNGVDTGDVIMDSLFPIEQNSNIRELHEMADEAFPEMLVEVLRQLESDSFSLKKQEISKASYYPLRFSEDGLIFWDMFTAEQIHNRIRALTEPYPCAFTYYQGRKVKILSSKLRETNFFGEPGRVYLKKGGNLLVCAKDKCLWITESIFEDTGESLYSEILRYERLATVMGAIDNLYKTQSNMQHNDQ